jgi:drug/metabolite transporter superfamily protein YnfA
MAVAWGWLVERIELARWDVIGAFVALLGMGIIAIRPAEHWRSASASSAAP